MSRVAPSGGKTCPTDICPPENNSNSRLLPADLPALMDFFFSARTSGKEPAEISLLSLEGDHMLADQLVQASCLMRVASCI